MKSTFDWKIATSKHSYNMHALKTSILSTSQRRLSISLPTNDENIKNWVKPLQWVSSGSIHLFFYSYQVCVYSIFMLEWNERADIGVGARDSRSRVYRPIHALARRSPSLQNDAGIGRGTSADVGWQVPLGSRWVSASCRFFTLSLRKPDALGATMKPASSLDELIFRRLVSAVWSGGGRGRVELTHIEFYITFLVRFILPRAMVIFVYANVVSAFLRQICVKCQMCFPQFAIKVAWSAINKNRESAAYCGK